MEQLSSSERRESKQIKIRTSEILKSKLSTSTPIEQPKSKNPFLYDDFPGPGEKAGIVIACFLLIPLVRFLLMVILILLCWAWAKIALIGAEKNTAQGLSSWRRTLIQPLRFFPRSVLFVLGFFWIPVYNRPPGCRAWFSVRARRRAPVVVSNHSTLLDVYLYMAELMPSFLSKTEVMQAPIFGTIASALMVIGVDRGSESDRKQAKQAMQAFVLDDHNPPLLIFPEGTTTNLDTVMTFKTGAFTLNTRVQPIAIMWDSHYFNIANTPTTPRPMWLLRLLCKPWHKVSLEYLPVHEPTLEELADAHLFAENVRTDLVKAIAKRKPLLGVQTTPQSTDDFLIWKALWEDRVPKLPQTCFLDFSFTEVRQALADVLSLPLSKRNFNSVVKQVVSAKSVLSICHRYSQVFHEQELGGGAFEKSATRPGNPSDRGFLTMDALGLALGLGNDVDDHRVVRLFSCFTSSAAVAFHVPENIFYLDLQTFVTQMLWLAPQTLEVLRELDLQDSKHSVISAQSQFVFVYLNLAGDACLCLDQVLKVFKKDTQVHIDAHEAWLNLGFEEDSRVSELEFIDAVLRSQDVSLIDETLRFVDRAFVERTRAWKINNKLDFPAFFIRPEKDQDNREAAERESLKEIEALQAAEPFEVSPDELANSHVETTMV